ncbi:MAG: LysR family transcriptional regulator [Paracoccaceae bacterium]
MGIDLRHFRCFVAVAEELHFHKAAKSLGVAQPALSRTIRNLENELGVTLFKRSNRSVEITKAGQSLLKGCKEILNKTNKIVEDARLVHQGKIGTLRIGYTDNAINGHAPDLLKRFQATQPDIELRLSHTVTSNQLIDLEEGRIDFGFATGSVARAGYDHCCIQRERFVCVVYKGHRFANRKSIRLEDLANEPMVQGVPEQWEHFYSYLTPMFRRAGFEPAIAQEGLATSDILRLVACGMGISILTESVADTLAPGLKIIQLDDVSDHLDTIVVWRTDQTNSAKEHFISFLQDALADVA